MPRWKEPPPEFSCAYKDHCPYIDGLSTHWLLSEHQRAHIREHEHWLTRQEMAEEIDQLNHTVSEQAEQIDALRAENKRLHQQRFKSKTARTSKTQRTQPRGSSPEESAAGKKRGAPVGHPPWTRRRPDRIDRTIEVDPPCRCPHCQGETDLSVTGESSFIQEDIVLRPQTVVTEYIHATAYCSACRRQVIRELDHELPFAPIGPHAKAAALYLRHELNLPYRKVQQAIQTLFGLDFVPASSLGFEKRAQKRAAGAYRELIAALRASDLVHADETYWRQDGRNHFVFYAGNEKVAVFHIDAHRSAEAAKILLGERIDGLLVTDGYAAYNGVTVQARQSCLAHLLRKAREVEDLLAAMKTADAASIRFCRTLQKLFKSACKKTIPAGQIARKAIYDQYLRVLDLICEKPLRFEKAETLRKRLIPGAREHDEVFAFIKFDGPPTNNHAERALRPLVIFRKVCMGTRSARGSENVAVFRSLVQTAKLQNASTISLLESLLTGSPDEVLAAVFDDSS